MKPRLLYIKLGEGSKWADECFTKGIVRISFHEISNEVFASQDLEKIRQKFIEFGYPIRAADMFKSQINSFILADQYTIWITFHRQQLWWCKTQREYHLDEDNTRYKKVIGEWSNKDTNGNLLWEDILSGALLKTKSYLSTLCIPDAEEYAWNKIHCLQAPETIQFEKDLAHFRLSTVSLLHKLQWQDFEILIDLIFRNAGFQRLSSIGKTMKTIDLSLLHPLTNEKLFVQIKSASDLETYEQWKKEMVIKNDNSTQYYFIVHSPKIDLRKYEEAEPEKFTLWKEKEISDMVIRFGLIDWLIQKIN